MRGAALLQILLVGFQLLLERLDKHLDGFLPFVQITLGGFLQPAERLLGQAQKFRRVLLQRVGAHGLEGVAQIGNRLFLRGPGVAQGLLLKLFLLGEK